MINYVDNPKLNETLVTCLRDWGIEFLTDIQARAVEAEVPLGSSAIVCAPTSSGKTLIGELALASALSNWLDALYLVSHKALAEQKFTDFTNRFTGPRWTNVTVGISTGDREEGDVNSRLLVSTYEKALGLVLAGRLVTAEPWTNIALNKPATQVNNYSGSTWAYQAVNGDANGVLANGVSATNTNANSWWQVDLQSVQTIASITVWGRTDCCPEQTSNFYVFVSDDPFTSYDLNTTINQAGVFNHLHSGHAGPGSIPVNRTGRYVRVQLAGTNNLVLGEVQVWSAAAKVNWLVTDHLATPRMILDKSGSLGDVSRHDYLPFGEEITVGRSTTPGYGATDGVRQKFTQKERDSETGLDYFGARYYESNQGRFSSPDPMMASAKLSNPQTMNRYVYVINNPLRYLDPDGLDGFDASDPWSRLTNKEQLLLAPKLTTVQEGYVPNDKQLAAAREAFNSKVIAYNADGSAVDLKQTATNVASFKAFTAELGSNKQAWAQVDQIGEVRAQGDGRVADVTFTAKNNDALVSALKGDSRFRYRESDAGHADSFRRITLSPNDPSFHLDRTGTTFGAHWDPTSTFNLQSRETIMGGTLSGNQMGVAGGLIEMGSAGIQHYGGRATVEQVQKFLTPSKQ